VSPASPGREAVAAEPAAPGGEAVAARLPPDAAGGETDVGPGAPADDAPGGHSREGDGAPAPATRRRGHHHTIGHMLWIVPRRLYEFYWGEGIADDVPALAYYLLLSLAPFALGLAALEALLLKDVVSALSVADQLNRFLPGALHGDIRKLVLGTRDNSPMLLALALFAMLWTTSGGIGVIERCLSRILGVPRHNILIGRVRNLGLGALVAFAVILASLSITIVTNVSSELRPGRGFPGPMILVFNGVGSMLVFATIYRYAPLTRMRWRSALLGGIPGGLALQAVPAVVGLYVSAANGFAAVQLFLLLAIMMLGLYIVALLLLVGAGIAGCAERRSWTSGERC
jgi:membrane protein